MAKLHNKIQSGKAIFQKYYGWFWISVAGSFVMLVLTLVSYFSSQQTFYLTLGVFYGFIILVRTVNFLICRHYGFEDGSRASVLNPLITGIAMLAAQSIFIAVLLIVINDKPMINFPFSWLIYGYAFYAFWKMGSAIKRLVVGLRKKNSCELSLSAIALSSGLFTMLTLMVNLIYLYGNQENTSVVRLGEVWMIAVSGFINLAFAVYLIVLGVLRIKDLHLKRVKKD